MSKLKPFKVVSENLIKKQGIFSFYQVDLRSPHSEKTLHRPLVVGSDFVVMIPRDNEGRFYLKREWRVAQKEIIWEFPGGGIDMDTYTEKDVYDAANRELQEEVDVKANKLTKLAVFTVGNYIRINCHMFLAEELQSSSLEADEDEHIEVGVFDFEETKRLITQESIPTAQSVIALQFAEKAHNGELEGGI